MSYIPLILYLYCYFCCCCCIVIVIIIIVIAIVIVIVIVIIVLGKIIDPRHVPLSSWYFDSAALPVDAKVHQVQGKMFSEKKSRTQESKICNEGTVKYQLHSVLHWIKKSFMSAFVTHKIRTQCLQNMHYALLNDENSPNFVSWEAVLRFGWKRLLSPSSSWRGGLMLLSEEEWS